MSNKIVCLMGPTAAGKTDLSLQLAEDLSCEVVSVDSAMVYKMMDVGTAKPSHDVRVKVKHHLIDIVDPNESYSAARFVKDGLDAIQSIQRQGKLPVLVGGTMLYFKALQQGLSPLPSADEAVRAELLREASEIGWQKMHKRLASVDPESASRINENDPQRIQRALEVYEITGKPLTFLWGNKEHQNDFEYINIAIAPKERAVIHERIEKRFLYMLNHGLIEEVNALYTRSDLHMDLPAMRSVGYRQVWQYLAGILSRNEMIEKGIAASRQLAKRQLTWLRHWDSINWFDSTETNAYEKILEYVHKYTNGHQI